MKLNTDCVRDLLIFLENSLSYDVSNICINNISLKNYSTDDLLYASEKLLEADYIKGDIVGDGTPPIIIINTISFNGHQFLNNVKNDNVWKAVKTKASKLAVLSIPIVQELSTSITKKIIGLT